MSSTGYQRRPPPRGLALSKLPSIASATCLSERALFCPTYGNSCISRQFSRGIGFYRDVHAWADTACCWRRWEGALRMHCLFFFFWLRLVVVFDFDFPPFWCSLISFRRLPTLLRVITSASGSTTTIWFGVRLCYHTNGCCSCRRTLPLRMQR